ncbi:unnamed protein product [Mytilus coruscus]|uniref:Uncharacterized protein n=1 Tax=Mytilus coruscus TaxID=42192 RepID=A0A6J8CF80_MYTCO|nr:unnamed protein product [Mytilus coruscus]
MIIFICAFIFVSEISCLHILPCEPGDPGPLGCDQFVRNGGQLGAGQASNPGNVRTFGTGSGNSIGFWNNQNIAGMQFIDPTQIANPSQLVEPTAQFLDPTTQFLDPTTQFLDPTSQFIDPSFRDQSFAGPVSAGQFDPTLQFIDPTQIVDPSFNGAVGEGQLDQPSGPLTTGLDFVGGKSKMPISYPKGKFMTKGKSITKGYPKGMLKKNSIGGYPKRLMVRYPKKYVKSIHGYPKGKRQTYTKYPNVYQKAYSHPKKYKVIRYLKKKYMIGGYPKFGLGMKTGYRKGISYSKGYSKYSISK